MKSESLKSRFRRIADTLDDRFSPGFAYVVDGGVGGVLAADPIRIADVGAAGGADGRWAGVRDWVRFITFEPDRRSTQSGDANFSVGLGAKAGERVLQLTKLPQASSLYPLDAESLADFANWDSHEVVGELSIPVDTLDGCLRARPELRPDFLKVDAEGADYEVLEGASEALTTSILGVQVEVSFISRHVGAAGFADTDALLRRAGFSLFSLNREHWVRRNRVSCATAQPQLIWADAVYFLDRRTFLSRLRGAAPDTRIATLTKFVLLLLCYGSFDYALEVVDAAEAALLIPEDRAGGLRRVVVSSVQHSRRFILGQVGAVVVLMAAFLVAAPSARARRSLGRRLSRGAGTLMHYLGRLARERGDHRYHMTDPF